MQADTSPTIYLDDANARWHVPRHLPGWCQASRHVPNHLPGWCQCKPTRPPPSTWMMPMQADTSPTIYLDDANASRHVPHHLAGWCHWKPTRHPTSPWMMPMPYILVCDGTAVILQYRRSLYDLELMTTLKRLYLTHLNVFTSLTKTSLPHTLNVFTSLA